MQDKNSVELSSGTSTDKETPRHNDSENSFLLRKRKPIPPGYTVHFTRNGQAYLIKEGAEDPEADAAAAEEHVRKAHKLSLCCSREELAAEFGEGIYQYFDFIFYLIVTNVLLLVTSLISLIPHFIIDGWQSDLPRGPQENFYLSSYSPQMYWWWVASTVLSALIYLFCFGPILTIRIQRRFAKIGYDDDEDRYLLDADAVDVIKDETGMPANPRRLQIWRLVISYFLFCVVLLLSGLVTLTLVIAQLYVDQADIATSDDSEVFSLVRGFALSMGVSIVLAVMNVIWKFVCEKLTYFERHYTWSRHVNHHTAKFFVWRILNVCLMFLARYLVSIGVLRNFFVWEWINNLVGLIGDVKDVNCQLGYLGEQLLTLFIVDIVLGNLVELLLPWAQYKFAQCRGQVVAKNLDSGRPEFDAAEEYLELLYRQFLVYIGISVLPPVALLALIANLIEYPFDKFRLLKLLKTPPPLRGSMHHFLVFFLFISAVIAVGVFPYGIGWVLAGWNFKDACPNTIFLAAPFNSTNDIPFNITIPI